MSQVDIEQSVRAQLTAPGAPFETVVEPVLGVVVPAPDSLTGQAVKAVVVVGDGAPPSEDDLESWCRESLAPCKVPTRWECRREPLPRNPSGKVLKGLLLGRDENRFEGGAAPTRSGTSEESK